jgi:dienelactone hydrolase
MSFESAGATPSDPSGPGPYRAGFTQFIAIDATRNGDSGLGGRPQIISVFYPVDAADVGASTAHAIYPFNPIFEPAFGGPPSEKFEEYGLDPSFTGVAPSKGAPFPLVMYSPGWSAHWLSAIWFGTRLASHGFVVAVLYHYGDGAFPQDSLPQLAPLAQAAFDRPRDISFALDRILERNGQVGDLLFGTVHPDRVAAGGWSLGGYAAMVLASGDDSVCDIEFPFLAHTCVPSLPDPRIKALVLHDGSSWALWFHEIQRITVPTLATGQDYETLSGVDEIRAAWHARQHAANSGHPSYRVDILRSRHNASFSNSCEIVLVGRDLGLLTPAEAAAFLSALECFDPTAIPFRTAQEINLRYAVAFLKTELARAPGYQELLTPGWAITREPDAQFFVTEKRAAVAAGPSEDGWLDHFWYFTTQPGGDRWHAEKNPVPRPTEVREPSFDGTSKISRELVIRDEGETK